MASDRDEIQSSGRSGGRLVLPDMPPGDPPLQDTALRFRQDCEQLLAKHSLLGVARGEYPPRALAVEENFPLELLPPLDPSTATANTVRSGNMPFSHFWPAVVSSLLASVQFELLLPSFLARAHRPKGIDCPVTSEPGR